MQNTTADYKLEINKPSRSFECKITIGNNIYNNEDLVNLTLEYTQLQEGFSIGSTISKSLDLTLLNRGDIIYSTSQIKVEIGLKIDSKIEYILMGIFNIDDVIKTDYTTKFTCYDNMIKFETPYYSSLGDRATLQQVVNELSSKTGVQFTGSLPAYTVSKLEGFSCREVLSYVSSICGGNAFITRDGKFTIKRLSEVEKTIDGNNYFDYKREEVKYKVGKISCQVDEKNILSKGSLGIDSMELQFENPWITETILTEIYNKLNGLSYLGYSMKWQGDISLDPYDIITVTDVKNVTRKIPILSQKLSYTGGLTSEIGAKGETKNKNSFSSSGSTTNKVNRAVIEQALIKEALIEKANIKDLEAVSIRTQTLEVKTAKIEEAIIDVAHISDLNAINANIEKLIAADATINNALIGKADITELNVVKGTITSLDSKIANIETLVNGNLSSENIQAGGITSDKLTIANGFITNAMIANLDVAKINAGDISTTKFRIVSDSGKMLISDNTIQIRDNNRVRVQIGKDASNDYNMYVWDAAGKLMFDATGLKADGIKNKIIRNDMISDNANIDGSKINISTLITEINKDTNTAVIKSSKVQLDTVGQTLEVAFNSLKNQSDSTKSLTESHSTTIGVMQGQINTAINNTQIVKDGQTILLKDDYNRTVATVNSINSTIGTHTTKINELTGSIASVDTKVNSVQRDLEGTKSTVSSHTSQINGLNSTVSTQGSSISQLQNQIRLKVEATDITTAINNIQIGTRNLAQNTSNEYSSVYTSFTGVTNTCPYLAKVLTDGLSVGDYLTVRLIYKYTDIVAVSGQTAACWIQGNGNVTNWSSGGFTASSRLTLSGSGEYEFLYTFKITADHLKNSYWNTNIRHDYVLSGSVQWKMFKVERGTKATDWSKAWEDIKTSINDVDSKVTTTSNKVSTIETNLSSITQRVASTESTVSTHTTQLGTVDSRINTAKNSAISTAANDATSKANTAQTNAINSAKGYTDGQITTVNQTIINKVAEIKTTTDSITQRVSSAESKITTVTIDLNNMQIGGTNIATETNKGVNGWGWSLQSGGKTISEVTENGIKCCKIVRDSVASTGWSFISYNRIGRSRYLANKKYTISFEVKASVVTTFYVGLKDGNGSNALSGDGKTGSTIVNTWTRLSVTITTFATLPTSTAQVLYLNGMNSAPGVTYIFRNLIIEEGTKASNWSPAPEDIESSIANVQTQVTTTSNKVSTIETNLSSITQRVASTESTVSTHTTQLGTVDSRINTAKNSAISTAANDATSKANTAQTNAINSAKGYTDGQITTVNKTITTKLAEIKATTDSITSKVQSIENTTTTINGNVTSLQSRITTAEQKITPTAIVNTISSTITGGTGSISTTQFIMDKNGLTIKNGALKIQNKSGTTVFNSDTNGNLIITGTLKSQKGDMFVALDSGGVTFQDWNRKEQMLRMAMTSFSSNRDYNGVTFAMPQYSDFIRFSYVSKSDLTNGWSSSDTQYSFFDLWSGDRTIEGKTFKKGINIHAPIHVGTNGILLDSGNAHTSDLKGNLTWNTINGLMGVIGDNGCFLGYKNGEAYNARLVITEGAHPGTGDNIRSYGNWNASAYTIHNAHFNGLSLTIKGSKNCIQETKNYGERLINAYETAEYFYGDLGFGKINEDGECLIYIDDIFSECVNTDIEYHVFTQAYTGLIKTIERCKTYFIVRGDAGTEFSWEFKAKRPGYEENRLDIMSEENQGENETELEDLLLMEEIA